MKGTESKDSKEKAKDRSLALENKSYTHISSNKILYYKLISCLWHVYLWTFLQSYILIMPKQYAILETNCCPKGLNVLLALHAFAHAVFS